MRCGSAWKKGSDSVLMKSRCRLPWSARESADGALDTSDGGAAGRLGFQGIVVAGDRTVITVRSICAEARCPTCGEPAHRIHSRYARTLLDLPMGGRSVRLVEAREIVEAFHALVRKKTVAALDPWLDRAGSSLVGTFARGLARDQLAVRAAIATAWSNAQAEG